MTRIDQRPTACHKLSWKINIDVFNLKEKSFSVRELIRGNNVEEILKEKGQNL